MTNLENIYAPQLNPNEDVVKIIEWRVKNLSYVKIDTHIASIESSKVIEEIYNEKVGYIKILKNVGQDVKSGEIIAVLGDDKNQLLNMKSNLYKNEDKKDVENTNITAKAKKLIKKYKLNIENKKTNKIINEKFVLEYLKDNNINLNDSDRKKNSKLLSDFQKKIANTVKQSQIENAYTFMNIEMKKHKLQKIIIKKNKELSLNLNLFDLITYILPLSIDEFPVFNSYLKDDELIQHKNINIGFTVEYNHKLYMPVLHDVKNSSLSEIIKKKFELIRNIYQNKLNNSMFLNGTISIATIDKDNIKNHFPIIYPNQSAIIGIGSFNKHSNDLIDDDNIGLTITYDHRIINGNYCADFLNHLLNNLSKV